MCAMVCRAAVTKATREKDKKKTEAKRLAYWKEMLPVEIDKQLHELIYSKWMEDGAVRWRFGRGGIRRQASCTVSDRVLWYHRCSKRRKSYLFLAAEDDAAMQERRVMYYFLYYFLLHNRSGATCKEVVDAAATPLTHQVHHPPLMPRYTQQPGPATSLLKAVLKVFRGCIQAGKVYVPPIYV